MKKRFFTRRFRRWLYQLVKEEQELDADNWSRDVRPCTWCQHPIALDSLFCKYCGFALATTEKQTTGHHQLVNVLPAQPGQRERDQGRQVIITNEIASLMNVGLRPIDAYNELKREGKK